MSTQNGKKLCYKETRTYAQADKAERTLIEQYAHEQGIDRGQLFYQLYLNDLTHMLTDEERKKASGPGETIMVSAVIFSIISAALMQPIPVFISTVFLFAATILFLTGCFNPYEQEKRRLRKLLRDEQSKIEPYDEWIKTHSS